MTDTTPLHRPVESFKIEERISIRCRSLYQSPESLARVFRTEVLTIKRIIKDEIERSPVLPQFY